MHLFKAEDLLNSYYDNGFYELEFTNGWIRKIPEAEHEGAKEYEHYWDNQLNISWATGEGEWEVNKEYLEIAIEQSVNDLVEEVKNEKYDAYIQSNGLIWLEDSGMDYGGDDWNAKEVAQVENGKIINWR